MGCDIHTITQRRADGVWKNLPVTPFDWRSYGMFAFLAGVRNYSDIRPISMPRGLPEDFDNGEDGEGEYVGDHSFSWLTLKELLDFDYDQPVEDRRVTVQTGPNSWDGGATAEPGGGKMTTYRTFLGQGFFDDLELLRKVEAERIVFGFDS